jgi:DHA1 family multidrug resistance protein-like MFS transporter
MAIFGVSQVAATLGLCLFVAGYGLGPMIFSPMSEIPQIGRNPVYLITLALFLAFRFITGFFGSPVLATGGASLADMYAPSKRAYAMSIWGIAAIVSTPNNLYGNHFANAAFSVDRHLDHS